MLVAAVSGEFSGLQSAASATAGSPEVWIVLVPAVVAAFFGILTGWLAAYLRVRAENYATKQDFEDALRRVAESTRVVGEENARIERRAVLDAELREAVRQYSVAAGSMIHSMAWLTWDVVRRRSVNKSMVVSYDAEIHKLFPIIVAQLAVIAMLNREVHLQLAPFAEEITNLDASLSLAILDEEDNPGSQADVLEVCYQRASALELKFRSGVSDLFPDSSRTASGGMRS